MFRIEVEQGDFLVIFSVLRVIVSPIGISGALVPPVLLIFSLRFEMIDLKLLVVHIEDRLPKLLSYNLILLVI